MSTTAASAAALSAKACSRDAAVVPGGGVGGADELTRFTAGADAPCDRAMAYALQARHE
jgi:enhancing lycopene biosynthesis protein 2